MRNLSAIDESKDLVTKEYVDNKIPSASMSDPAMDGTASPGSSTAYARGDHVHPTQIIPKTKAQYEQLTPEQKALDVSYYITDDDEESLVFDSVPTAGSSNPVTSNGIRSALDNVEALTAIPLSDPATASVAMGSYVVYQNGLYQTNAAISSGETATTFVSKLTSKPNGAINYAPVQFAKNQNTQTDRKISLYYVKIGGINFVNFVYISPREAIQANTMVTIGKVPDFSIPSGTTYFGGTIVNASATPIGVRGSVDNTGDIKMQFSSALSTSDSLFGTVVFIS